MIHYLKILPKHFQPVSEGKKLAELRENDRGFSVGDWLHLEEFDGKEYTGRNLTAEILHVADVGAYLNGYVLLSIKLLADKQ